MAWPGKLFCKISDFRWIINIYLNTILVYKFSKNKCDTCIFIYVYFIVVKKITWSWLSTNLHVNSTALLTLCKLLYSRALKLFHLSCLNPLTNIPPFSPPGNYHSTFLCYECDYFRYLIKVESCSICLSVTGLFCLAFLQGSFMW